VPPNVPQAVQPAARPLGKLLMVMPLRTFAAGWTACGTISAIFSLNP
jgi:hypothetical protein